MIRNYRDDEWIFFAISVDQEMGVARYAVNSYVVEESIEVRFGHAVNASTF